MPNEYNVKFNKLRENLKDYKYFSRKVIDISVKNTEHEFVVYKFNLNESIINNAADLASRKINFTMDYDPSGKVRSNSIKLGNQTKGILAEMGAQIILEDILGYKNVKRWDLDKFYE